MKLWMRNQPQWNEPFCNLLDYLLVFSIVVQSFLVCAFAYPVTCLFSLSMHGSSRIQSPYPIFVEKGSQHLQRGAFDVLQERRQAFISNLRAKADKADELLAGSTLHEDLMKNNELSHMMIKVKSVNETVAFYVDRGATSQTYRYNNKSGAESAFANFAPSKGILPPDNKGYFSLEIVKQSDKRKDAADAGEGTKQSNTVQFVGISMLKNFRDKSNLESVILSNKPKLPPLTVGDTSSSSCSSSKSTIADLDPNGINVQFVASAPGDGFAQLCLACQSGTATLSEIEEFYVDILGMELVAQDKNCICLRYQSVPLDTSTTKKEREDSNKRVGVPTTLVFATPKNDELAKSEGYDCFDHLVISTDDVSLAMEHIQTFLSTEKGAGDEEYIFMPPRPMFGTTLMGIKDPNGYDIYLMERPKNAAEKTVP